MDPLLTLPPILNLALYLLIVAGMIAVAVALDRWLAVAELRPAERKHHAPRPQASTTIDPATSRAPSPSHTTDLGPAASSPGTQARDVPDEHQ